MIKTFRIEHCGLDRNTVGLLFSFLLGYTSSFLLVRQARQGGPSHQSRFEEAKPKPAAHVWRIAQQALWPSGMQRLCFRASDKVLQTDTCQSFLEDLEAPQDVNSGHWRVL